MADMMNTQKRLKELFENAISSDLHYDGSFKDINCYNLLCKGVAKDCFHKIIGSNVSLFKCSYENEDAILMLFTIPINVENGTKHVAERVMEVVDLCERCFITLDYLQSKEVKEDKYVYVIVTKKLGKED